VRINKERRAEHKMTTITCSPYLVDIDNNDQVVIKRKTNNGIEDVNLEELCKDYTKMDNFVYDLIYAIQDLVRKRDKLLEQTKGTK
jgi:hypothetical protein